MASNAGHDRRSFNREVTDRYIEKVTSDVRSRRMVDVKPNRWDLEVTYEPFRPKRLSSEELTAACRERDLDPDDRSARYRIGEELREAREESWRKSVSSREPSAKLSTNISASAASLAESMSADMTAETLVATDSEMEDPAANPIDPAPLNTAEDCLGGRTENLAPDMVGDILQSADTASDNSFRGTRSDFIKYYSSINIVRHSTLSRSDRIRRKAFEGNGWVGGSKAPPTLFVYHCPTNARGCLYNTTRQGSLDSHLVVCKSTASNVLSAATGPKAKIVACPHEGCEKTCAIQYRLNEHIKKAHTSWTPKRCDGKGLNCQDTVFTSLEEWNRHRASYHGLDAAWVPQTCMVPLCRSTTLFKSLPNYKGHLTTVLKLSMEDWNQYLPEECLVKRGQQKAKAKRVGNG